MTRVLFPFAMIVFVWCVICSRWSRWTLRCLKVRDGRMMVPVTVVTASRCCRSSSVLWAVLLVFEKKWRRPLFENSYGTISV